MIVFVLMLALIAAHLILGSFPVTNTYSLHSVTRLLFSPYIFLVSLFGFNYEAIRAVDKFDQWAWKKMPPSAPPKKKEAKPKAEEKECHSHH